MVSLCNGLAQIFADITQFPCDDAFEATTFSTHEAFWMLHAIISISSSGILAAFYKPAEVSSGFGIVLINWTMVTLCWLNFTPRNVSLIGLSGMLALTLTS